MSNKEIYTSYKLGTVTADNDTAVSVTCSILKSTSMVLLSPVTFVGDDAGSAFVNGITINPDPALSTFSIVSTAADTSQYQYWVINFF